MPVLFAYINIVSMTKDAAEQHRLKKLSDFSGFCQIGFSLLFPIERYFCSLQRPPTEMME